MPPSPKYLPTPHSRRAAPGGSANDTISEGYAEQEAWKTQPHDDSAPPNEVSLSTGPGLHTIPTLRFQMANSELPPYMLEMITVCLQMIS